MAWIGRIALVLLLRRAGRVVLGRAARRGAGTNIVTVLGLAVVERIVAQRLGRRRGGGGRLFRRRFV